MAYIATCDVIERVLTEEIRNGVASLLFLLLLSTAFILQDIYKTEKTTT